MVATCMTIPPWPVPSPWTSFYREWVWPTPLAVWCPRLKPQLAGKRCGGGPGARVGSRPQCVEALRYAKI